MIEGQKRKLPGGWLLKVQVFWHWFRQDKRRDRFYMSMRGANFKSFFIGPLHIVFRMPWLEGPARQLHPECFD